MLKIYNDNEIGSKEIIDDKFKYHTLNNNIVQNSLQLLINEVLLNNSDLNIINDEYNEKVNIFLKKKKHS